MYAVVLPSLILNVAASAAALEMSLEEEFVERAGERRGVGVELSSWHPSLLDGLTKLGVDVKHLDFW